MPLNLKQVFSTDTDNNKLDKINYNFDQLIINSGGPQGYQGPEGTQGLRGVTGTQGFQGIMGPQGTIGPKGDDGVIYWNAVDGNNENGTFETLYPLHDASETDLPPNIVLGYVDTDPKYAQPDNSAVLIINRHVGFSSNIRLKNEDATEGFDWTVDVEAGDTVVTLSLDNPITTNNQYLQLANIFKFIDNDTSTTLLELDSSNLTIHVDSIFKDDVELSGNLKIASGTPGIGKIAISSDANGTITWEDSSEFSGNANIGFIISMLPSIFNDNTKFINEETYTIVDPDTDLLQVSVGRGLDDYEGWYLCNGKTWKNDTFSYEVPELNSFSYTIEKNTDTIDPQSQGNASVVNNTNNILGGADIALEATYDDQVYTISTTINTDSGLVDNDTSGTTYNIERLPQLIYLGETDLYWEDAGTGQIPVNTINYTFVDEDLNVVDVTGNIQAIAGTAGSQLVSIFTDTDEKWDSTNLPTITPPTGFTIGDTYISPSNIREYVVEVEWTDFPAPPVQSVEFTYNSTGSILPILNAYDVTFIFRDLDSNVANGIVAVNAIEGSSGESGDVTLTAPSGSVWNTDPQFTTNNNEITIYGLQFPITNNDSNVVVSVQYSQFPDSNATIFIDYSSNISFNTATIAYIANTNSNSITAIDLRDPNNMIELDSLSTNNLGFAEGIAIDLGTSVAYVTADLSDAITSININDPSNLRELDSFATSSINGGENVALDVVNEVAYVIGDFADSITSINISDPNNLVELDSLTTLSLEGAHGIVLDLTNEVAYVVSEGADSIVAIDISNPSNLVILDSYNPSGLNGARGVDIDVVNEVAYVASSISDSITSIDYNLIRNPSILDSYTSVNLNGATGVAIDTTNQVAYVTSENADSITAINISNPSILSELDSYTSVNLNGAWGISLDLVQNIAYVTSSISDSITSIDISNPSNLSELDSYTSTNLNGARSIALNIPGPASTNAYE